MAEASRQGLLSAELAAPPPVRRTARRANDLDGKAWQRNSISIWTDIEKTPAERRLAHPAVFPSALLECLAGCFTRSDERVVLGPVTGTGSSLVGRPRLPRAAKRVLRLGTYLRGVALWPQTGGVA
jgi:hypothetical protein